MAITNGSRCAEPISLRSKVVVAGVCMQTDTFEPSYAVFKEIDMVFCMAYTIEEFAQALGHLAAGELQVAPLVTSHVGLEGVAEAFARLSDPEKDAKIIVTPHGV